jgi:hypothetical protein
MQVIQKFSIGFQELPDLKGKIIQTLHVFSISFRFLALGLAHPLMDLAHQS